LQKIITLSVKDFEEVVASPRAKVDAESLAEGEQPEGGILVMNPPYGKRLFTDVPTFYKMVGNVLKKYFQGSEAWIISSDDPNATFGYTDPRGFRKEGTPFDFVGLKPSLKIELNNGGIPCQLRKYELFSGKYDEFRKDGNELDKQSADQKQDNDRYDRVRKDYGKKGGRSFDKKDGKPFKKDGKPFKKEGKDDDKKKRFFDKDGKSYERGHKPAGKDRPTRTKSSGTERTYTVNKDGSISVSRATSSERREDRKERRDEKRAPRTERPNRGNFKRGADGKFEERTGDYQPRGRRTYDPNRPMFGEDFDMSKAVLDYTKKPEDNNNENK